MLNWKSWQKQLWGPGKSLVLGNLLPVLILRSLGQTWGRPEPREFQPHVAVATLNLAVAIAKD